MTASDAGCARPAPLRAERQSFACRGSGKSSMIDEVICRSGSVSVWRGANRIRKTVRNSATPKPSPIGGRVDCDHRNAKPAFGLIGDIDNRKIGAGLYDGIDTRCQRGLSIRRECRLRLHARSALRSAASGCGPSRPRSRDPRNTERHEHRRSADRVSEFRFFVHLRSASAPECRHPNPLSPARRRDPAALQEASRCRPCRPRRSGSTSP